MKDKGTHLLAFLKAAATLRQGRISSYGPGDRLIWFAKVPRDCHECQSPFLVHDANGTAESWFQVRKKARPERPPPPDTTADWVLEEELDQFNAEPELQSQIIVSVEVEHDALEFDNVPITYSRLADFPQVQEDWLEYLINEWEPWAKEMRRWQAIQEVYENLDFMRRRLEEAEERFELLLAVGLLQWRDPTDKAVKRHILTAPAEITFDAARGLLNVIPSATFDHFEIELDMLDHQHQPSLKLAVIESQLAELDIQAWSTGLVAPILHEIANRLHPDAQVDEERFTAFHRTEVRPRVSFAPAILLRKRRPRAYDKLISKFLESARSGELTSSRPWSLLLSEGDTSQDSTSDSQIKPTGDVPSRLDLERYLFPLAANDEQRKIVERLHINPCVLVRGPPGTGKSQTIANLICHLLSKGNRILVTAQAPKALAVLRELLPCDVRDLCVTALGSSRDDQRLLEESVRRILKRQKDSRGLAHDQGIIDRTEERLQDLEGELARLERALLESREAETHPHTLSGGYQGTAAQVARKVDQEYQQFGWLPDCEGFDSQFPMSDEEVTFLAEVHGRLNQEKRLELSLNVGDAELPEPDEVKQLTAKLANAEESATQAVHKAEPEKMEALEKSSSQSLNELCQGLRALEDLVAKATRVLGDFTEEIIADLLVGSTERWNRLASEAEDVLQHATILMSRLRKKTIEIPSGLSRQRLHSDARRRLHHFKRGGRRGFWVFSPQVVKETSYIEESCLVNGERPDTVKRLDSIVARLDLDKSTGKVAGLWQSALPERPGSRLDIDHADIAHSQDLTNQLLHFLSFLDSNEMSSIASVLMGNRSSLSSSTERKQWLSAASAVLAQQASQDIQDDLDGILDLIESCRNGHDHLCLNGLAQAVKTRDDSAYRKAWNKREQIRERKDRLANYESVLEELESSCRGLGKLLRASEGEPEWAIKINEMRRAWAWSSARSWLCRISSASAHIELVREFHLCQNRIEKSIKDLVSIKSWRRFFDRLDKRTIQSLNAWTKAVSRIGKGTGKYAHRHRRTARRYLMDCVPQIPAWVMPLYRLWDMVDAKPGLFDTIIVDEASQAGTDALALLLLAKRIIVVGDDKQNSPEAVGILEDNIAYLAKEYLSQFRFCNEYRPDASLFDHAERSFENPITLREHFRCVPEIIRFSNDLCYRDSPLIPLRQAPPDRLPAIDSRFIAEGRCERTGTRIINRSEASSVIKEIESAIKDEGYKGKSMGVIVLQGHAQGHLIEQELAMRLAPSTIESRRLRCGVPAAFQGDERDVIFLSLVVAPNIRYRALTRLADQRRFNVAMSRARDHVRLFHSVQQHDLGPEDLRRRLIEFFQNPMHGVLQKQSIDLDHLEREARVRRIRGNQPEPYESWFEVDVALELLRLRFVVHPQVEISNYRIDLVVEGNDARLAVECDGDEWHGEDSYEHDMARQRQLERAGWSFVRIRESAFYVNRKAAVKTVVDACNELGIRCLSSPRDTSKQSRGERDQPSNLEGVVLRPSSVHVDARTSEVSESLGESEEYSGDELADRKTDFASEEEKDIGDFANVQSSTVEVLQDEAQALLDFGDSPWSIRLHWNRRYESAKSQLVQRIEALKRISPKSDFVRANRTIDAIRSLPVVGDNWGSVRIVDHRAKKVGDSDFVYSLSVTDEGFKLSYHEQMMVRHGQSEFAYPDTLVQCRPIDSEEVGESSDEEGLVNMREGIEMFFGMKFDDEEWRMQLDWAAQSGDSDLVPNGISRWLDMLPVDDDGTCPNTVRINWDWVHDSD